ncbi:NADH:flavin oxidoreductase / NADH oxidase family protein [Sarocladium implicatum]|nr:NADH:flavin oxidoreductase / NADH oxidase family protein [Sarocladium implicatum]
MLNHIQSQNVSDEVAEVSRLFQPVTIGNMRLQHRIGMAPMSRTRTLKGRVPGPMMREYYGQRASVPGTLIISEGITVSPAMSGGYAAPGIWTPEQIHAWKEITGEVHRKGSFIVAQLFGFGRVAEEEVVKREGIEIVGPSAIPIDESYPTPRAMTAGEIAQMVKDFATASKNAIEAGFDGVECHGANGYILDQFLREVSNQRDDAYGGSIASRSRAVEEVLSAMVDAVGADRVGLRLSPFSSFQGMAMPDPIPQHEQIIRKANELGLMYISMIEPRVSGPFDVKPAGSNDFAYRIWEGKMLVAGGYKPESARKQVDEEHAERDVVVLFARSFIGNPDLVYRIEKGLALGGYDHSATYGVDTRKGYLDYEFSKEFLEDFKTDALEIL